MPEDKHTRGGFKGEFCSQPADPPCDDCPHSKNYKEVCKPNWKQLTFKRLKQGAKGLYVKDYPYEAHHLLCVGSVTDKILGEPKIETVVQQTKWCINGDVNMLAMPLWGHTLQHYTDFYDAGFSDAQPGGYQDPTGVALRDDPPPPDFANIPMHNFGHNTKKGYKYETDVRCGHLAGKIAKAKKKHANKKKQLKKQLDNMSKSFRSKLTARGLRAGGTHSGWLTGLNDRDSDEWYKPFSMDIKPKKITFPVSKEFLKSGLSAKLKKMVIAFWYG